MTELERIRQMNDEELIDFVYKITNHTYPCYDCCNSNCDEDNAKIECVKKHLNREIDSVPKMYEASVHGIMNNWTDREWELFKTIKPFDLEEKMVVYFDNWLHENVNDENRHCMDLRGE